MKTQSYCIGYIELLKQPTTLICCGEYLIDLLIEGSRPLFGCYFSKSIIKLLSRAIVTFYFMLVSPHAFYSENVCCFTGVQVQILYMEINIFHPG